MPTAFALPPLPENLQHASAVACIWINDPGAITKAFIVTSTGRAANDRDLISWVTRGLYHRVPKYQVGVTDDGAFTRQVEALCGPQAKGAFQSKYGFHALSPSWARKLGLPPTREGVETLSCLMNAAAIAGFTIRFTCNEAFAPSK